MQEGIQLPELLAKIKALREAGLRAEHVAFSFMKRRVQPLMARDTLGYQYTGEGDSSRRTRPALCPSTPPLIRRTRSVAVLNVRVLIM
jgi:hypothetical protein